MIEFTLENVLAIVIALITLNLLFIGFYIVSVLREVKKTVHRAGTIIDEVDRTVKDGIEKANAIQAPMQALASTAAAFGGIIKSTGAIRKATQSILGTNEADTESENGLNEDESSSKNKKQGFFSRPKFFKR